jgi:hypothetical protein
MGIRGLTSLIKPYGPRDTIKPGDNVIVDGPSFAYHIYHICRQKYSVNPCEYHYPTYRDFTRTALTYLDTLISHGIHIVSIDFDGSLPPHKRTVRLQRAYQLHRDTVVSHETRVKQEEEPTQPVQNGVNRHQPAFRKHHAVTSPPSFLVPLVIDALRYHHRYGTITHIVPMEADLSCVIRLRMLPPGGIILTNDSDLLIYAAGVDGSVVFFPDLDLPDKRSSSPHVPIKCIRYYPSRIERRLGWPLVQVAYQLTRKRHKHIRHAVTACVARKVDSQEYDAFKEQFSIISNALQESPPTAWHASLCRLDPRLAELYAQFMLLNNAMSGPCGEAGIQYPEIFLPCLIRPLSHETPWSIWTPIRQMAYSMLRDTSNSFLVDVIEHDQIQSLAPRGNHIGLLSTSKQKDLAFKLSKFLVHALQQHVNNTLWLQWCGFPPCWSLYECPSSSTCIGKSDAAATWLAHGGMYDSQLPSSQRVQSIILQAQAFVHSLLYSLRILSQTLAHRNFKQMTQYTSFEKLGRILYQVPDISAYPELREKAELEAFVHDISANT